MIQKGIENRYLVNRGYSGNPFKKTPKKWLLDKLYQSYTVDLTKSAHSQTRYTDSILT